MQLKKSAHKILIGSLAFLGVGVMFFTLSQKLPVFSDEIDDIQSEIEETEAEKKAKEDVLKGVQADISKINSSNLSISAKIAALDKEIKEIASQQDKLEKEVKAKQAIVEQKSAELEKKLSEIQELSKQLYKNSRLSVLDILLSNNSGVNFIRAYNLKKYVTSKQISKSLTIQNELEALNLEKAKLDQELSIIAAQRSALDEARSALKNEQARIQQQLIAQAALQNALKNEIKKINTQLSSLSAALQAAIDAKVGNGGDDTGGGNYGGGTSPQPPSGNPGQYDIYVNGTKVADNKSGPIRIVSSTPNYNNVFRVNGSLLYRGILEFRADSNMYMIEELPLEQYLYGLGEVPSSWPAEALKTQVVAGRTYAAANWNKRLGDKYNLRDDTFDQNYVGYSKEIASYGGAWKAAVDATPGKALYSGGALISTYYHSTCSGHTLSSQEVWGGYRSYALAEPDRTDQRDAHGDLISYGAPGQAPSGSSLDKKRWCGESWQACTSNDNIDDTEAIDLINATIYLTKFPNNQNNILPPASGGWTSAQIEAALGAEKIQSRVGTLVDIQSVYNNGTTTLETDSRKTTAVRIVGSTGSYDISGTNFWTVFNVRSPGVNHIYYSNLWTSQKVSGYWVFYTRGYGHRVGMCQYGAYGRAVAGQNYSTILSAYYNGSNLGTFNPPSVFRVGITRVATGDVTVSSEIGGSYALFANGTQVVSTGAGNTMRIVKQ
ncbi:MAG: hypothetical protein Fur003_2710 [Candidatus Dojkabacteria bacterium]